MDRFIGCHRSGLLYEIVQFATRAIEQSAPHKHEPDTQVSIVTTSVGLVPDGDSSGSYQTNRRPLAPLSPEIASGDSKKRGGIKGSSL